MGVRERVERMGARMIREWMPDEHRELFAELPLLIAGSVDDRGRPWASPLVGEPGFISSPDPQTLHVAAPPGTGDPLGPRLVAGAPIGLLGLQFETRRRSRANGRVLRADAGGFSVRVEQSFGNCPKYIQARVPMVVADPAATARAWQPRREGAQLSARAREIVANADTFFIATAAVGEGGAVDVSHRGGRPGFLHIEDSLGATVLVSPDYIGNFMFMTLGNLAVHARAGLLIPAFDERAVLSLTCTAETIWDGPQLAAYPQAQRLARFTVEEGFLVERALPLAWTPPEFAPDLR
jgi:predicted pyridoxine 5'-phosphate oxidase superfamily flavin-nucleotide-binding protein